MAYNVSALTAYVDQNNFPLLRKSLLSNKTIKLVTVQSGIKSAESLNIIDTTATFQAAGCGFNASGTTTFTQRVITVGKFKVEQDFCPVTLEAYYTQLQLKPGSDYSDQPMPFEQTFTDLQADYISQQLEIAAWQGDTGSGTNNLSYFDGFLKQISGCAGYVTGNTTSITGITSSNVLAIVDGIYEAIPAQILAKPDVMIFCGMDTYRLYTVALKNQNLFNYAVNQTDFEIVIPGTNIKLVGLNGLTGTSAIVAARTSNLFIGVDLQSDQDNFKIWWSDDFQATRMHVGMKYGTQVAFCNEIVYWHI